MIRRTQIFLAAFFLIASLSSASAQTPAPSPKNATPAKSPAGDKSKAARDEAKRLAEQRRATAIALLLSLADEARSYRNQTLRARVQARSADLLWESDAEKARTLFRRAWESADAADAESQRRFDEERRAQEEAGKPFNGAFPPSVRTEVLRMAAKRERALGEELLAKLDEARKQEAANASTQQDKPDVETADPFELPPTLRLRLRLARQLLDSDVPRAIEFADPALGRVSVEALVFLAYLRAKNAVAADERYAAMLTRAGADMASDANTISLLSSYLFTPFLFVRQTPEGATNSSQYDQNQTPPDVAPELRALFFRVAEQVFLRPLPPPDQDRTTSGRIGKYLIMSRLMPYFEQYAPEQATTLVRAQLTALGREIPDEYRQRGERSVTRANDSDDSGRDTIESILAQVERAQNQDARDDLYVQAAVMAAEKDDARAFDLADKIENTDVRKSVRAYVDFVATRHAVEKKRTEEAIKLARKGALTNMQRVWVLTELAELLSKSDRETALELIDEAGAEARRIGGSSADRPRALVAVATRLFELDRQRGWDLMTEVVRASNNAAEDFSGEDARIVASLQTRANTSIQTHTADEFDIPRIFRLLTADNLERAILLAKDFNGESPRATALIAIVRAELEKKQEAKGKK